MSQWLSAPQFCSMFACRAVHFVRHFKLLHILLLPLFSMGRKSVKSAKDTLKSSLSLSSASPPWILCQCGTGVSTPQFARGPSRISTHSYLQMQIRSPLLPALHGKKLEHTFQGATGRRWPVQTVSYDLCKQYRSICGCTSRETAWAESTKAGSISWEMSERGPRTLYHLSVTPNRPCICICLILPCPWLYSVSMYSYFSCPKRRFPSTQTMSCK